MTERARAALLLSNRLVDLGAAPLTASEYWSLLLRVPEPERLLEPGAIPALLVDGVLSGSEADRLHVLLAGASAFAFERERLEEAGIRLVSTFDGAYPVHLLAALGSSCPAFLTVAGPIEWLARPGIGVVSSRASPAEAVEVAARVVQLALDHGLPVVCDLAVGVDTATMRAADASGAPVVGVAADGLRITGKQPDVRTRVHAGQLCITSPYGPSARATAASTTGSNSIVHGLSSVTLVVHADSGAPASQGAADALRKGYGNIAVWQGPGAGPGNHDLIQLGASPVSDLGQLLHVQPGRAAEPTAPTLF